MSKQDLIVLLNASIRRHYHSVRQAGVEMGISQSMLSRIVLGDLAISAINAIRIADYVGITRATALQMAGHGDLVALLGEEKPLVNKATEAHGSYDLNADWTMESAIRTIMKPLSATEQEGAIDLLRVYVTQVCKKGVNE